MLNSVAVVPQDPNAYKVAKDLTRYENVPGAARWVHENMAFDDINAMLADNRKLFQDLFGPPTCHHRGEFRASIWGFDNGFFLTTSKRGSSIEVPKHTSLEQIKDFLLPLAGKLTPPKPGAWTVSQPRIIGPANPVATIHQDLLTPKGELALVFVYNNAEETKPYIHRILECLNKSETIGPTPDAHALEPANRPVGLSHKKRSRTHR